MKKKDLFASGGVDRIQYKGGLSMIKKKLISALLALVMVCTLLPMNLPVAKAATTSDPGRRVVGYLPSYRMGTVNSIDFSALTHCNLSFMTYSNGTLTSGFSAGDVQTIVSKCHANGVKALIAVGGWNGFNTSDGPFTTAAKRTSFVNQLMNYVNTYNLDGVDLDLEVTDAGVWNNFDALVSELSSRLKASGKLLTMAVGTWFTGGIQNSTYQYFDFLNLMSYDYNQSGTGEVAPWSQIYDMISYYGSRGVSNDKLVIGVPFYGYGAGGTAYTYAEMVGSNAANANLDYANGVYYNGMSTIRKKAEYSKSYGGTMIWEIGQDSYSSYSLLGVIKDVMGSGSSQPQTTKAPSTNIPAGFTSAIQNDWVTSGNWGCYFGNWSGSATGAYKGGNGTPYQLYVETANVGVPWLIQARYDTNVVAGHKYKVTVNVTSDKAGNIGIKEDISNASTDQAYHDIRVGANTITATFDVTSNQMRVMFELGNGIQPGTTLTFNSIKIEDLTGTEVTTAPDTQETTEPQQPGTQPIEVIGQVISSKENNTITVVWGQSEQQIANGQKYNVYVDGVLKLSGVECAEHVISGIADGNHTVKITAVLNGKESTGVTGEINVAGGAAVETTTQTPETEEQAASNIEINGCQISTTKEGYRVVYSVNKGSDIESFGLVYGLASSTNMEEMVVNSTNSLVHDYPASNTGKVDVNYSGKNNYESYAMTMTLVKTAEFYNSEIYVRAYMKMKDGTYKYSAVKSLTVYDIADNLYSNKKMTNKAGHDYLFDNILSVVNPSYNAIDFDWKNIFA